jgi:hypothetical protein
MKTTTLQPREILAWIVLACAIALFSVSVSMAQDKKEKKSEIKIKIQKDTDGKQVKIDTVISADQLPALKEYLKEMDIDFDADALGSEKGIDKGNMVFHFKHPGMKKEDREAFEKEMEKLNIEMQELDHEMEDLHIEMFGFDDGDPENFDFHIQVPGSPNAPIPPRTFYFNGDDDSDSECQPGKKSSYHFRYSDDEVPDSLQGEDHIVLHGRKGEEAPALEKEIITKDGDKIFIYKRKLPKEEAKISASMPITRVKVYPNPGDGKLTVSFNSNTKADIQISITDAKGSEVYNKTIDGFSGEYSNQVDISGKGKGTYYLKISQGEDSVTKKILVE